LHFGRLHFGPIAFSPLVWTALRCDIAATMQRDPKFQPPESGAMPSLGAQPPSMMAPTLAGVRNANDDEDGDRGGRPGDGQVGIATRTRTRPKKPSMFKVLMLNDDYTPMEFVVMVLKRYFSMDIDQATQVMLHVHQRGVGVCGIFPYEIAETKVNQVMDFADKNQHPLRCTLEKA
jgi:ATP-dependent Clp protease adaptor protein ClpS